MIRRPFAFGAPADLFRGDGAWGTSKGSLAQAAVGRSDANHATRLLCGGRAAMHPPDNVTGRK